MKTEITYSRNRKDLRLCEIGERWGCKAVISSTPLDPHDLCNDIILAEYVAEMKIISEYRKWGVQQFFVFKDGFKIGAGHLNAKGNGGSTHYEDSSFPFDFGRDVSQTLNYLRDSLTTEDYLLVISHLTGIEIIFEY